MEYIDGKTLIDFLQETHTSKQILTVFLNLTYALNTLLSRGIIHGDISFENIMVESDLNIKLIDFEKSSNDIKELRLNTVGSSSSEYRRGYLALLEYSINRLKDKEIYIPMLENIKLIIKQCSKKHNAYNYDNPECRDVYNKCAKEIANNLKLEGGSKTRKTRKAIRTKAKKATRISKRKGHKV
jgi:serine/threonine protein kinase